MQDHVLGIDVGTGGTRAVVVDGNGRISRPRPRSMSRLLRRRSGGRSRVPRTGGAPAASPCGKPWLPRLCAADQIACVGFSGQMHGAVMLEPSDKVVRPALIWCDVRTEKQCRELTEQIGAREADPAHLQSCAAQFHFDQVSVGAGKRTGELEARPFGHAAQGLCSLPPDRRAGDGHGRRVRHIDAGCREPALVRGSAAGCRDRKIAAAAAV